MTDKTNMYQNGKIYTIRSSRCDKYYIGSTCNPLYKRFNLHKNAYNRYLNNKTNFRSSFEIVKLDDCYIELLENFSCNSRDELNKREGELIRQHKNNIVNINIAGRKILEYYDDNKTEILEQKREYYNINKNKILEQKRIKTLCECGCDIALHYLNRHKKSQKHIKMLSEKQ